MDLSFITAAAPRQSSHSRARVLRDSRPYFTVRDSTLPQPGGPGTRIYILQGRVAQLSPQAPGSYSSPPTTRRAMVEVFEPASTRATE
jgi:hypothetical protein